MRKPLVGCLVTMSMLSCKTNSGSGTSSESDDTPLPIVPLTKFEDRPEKEGEEVKFLIKVMMKLTRMNPSLGYAPRASGGKTQGCVLADYKVLDEKEIAPENRPYFLGMFKPGTQYKAWVRFSNSHGAEHQADSVRDGRMMSIKLLQIKDDSGQEKLLKQVLTEEEWANEERNTFDFELMNHPAFFAGNTRDMSDYAIDRAAYYKKWPRKYQIHEETESPGNYSPLDNVYWSETPFLLGKDNVVKYTSDPVDCKTGKPKVSKVRDRTPPNYLRQAMKEQLQEEEQCFALSMQVRKDSSLPVEDASVIWDEKGAPPIKFATLRIPKQSFDSPKQMEFCENLSYTIWHTLPQHQPLGGINRGRMHVYKVTSRARLHLNGFQKFEPTGDKDVERYPVKLP